MERASIFISMPDPELRVAREKAVKLLRDFKACQDPLTKKAVRTMIYNALNYELELKKKSGAREEVKNLHEELNPAINLN